MGRKSEYVRDAFAISLLRAVGKMLVLLISPALLL